MCRVLVDLVMSLTQETMVVVGKLGVKKEV